MMHAGFPQPLPGAPGFSVPPTSSSHGISHTPVRAGLLTEEMVRQLISLVDPAGADTGSKACIVIRFDSNGDTGPLDKAIRAFEAQAGRPGDCLGCILTMDGCHFAALCLQKDERGGLFFRYYDPSPSASSRHKLKEQICLCLCRRGIGLESYFTGVRPGDVKASGIEAANDSGIYAVLAMREMMKGKTQFDVAAQEIVAWKDKLFLAADAASRAVESETFMQALGGRSENARKLARRFAEHCPAIQHVLDCYSSREAARFQALNKRLYHNVLPQLMDHVSFQDYPVMPLVNLQTVFSGESGGTTGSDLAHEFGPAYLGWLVLSGMSIQVNMNPQRMKNFLRNNYADFNARRQKYSRKDRDVMALGDWLGKAVIAGCQIQRESQGKDPHVQGSFPKQLSVVDLFMNRPALPESYMKDVEAKLDEAVKQGVIRASVREMVLDNLQPVIRQLASRRMEVNIGILPKTEKGKEKRYVYVRATPGGYGGMKQEITIYKAEQRLCGENENVLLSSKLKGDIRQHFRKMGWADRLGPTLREKIALPEVQGNHEIKMLSLLIGQFVWWSGLSNEHQRAPVINQSASQDADAMSRTLYQTLKKVVSAIDPEIFEQDILNPAVFSIEALCRVSSALLKVAKHFMATRSMPAEELLKYQTMLKKCRKKLLDKVGRSGKEAPVEGVSSLEARAYTEVNDLNDGIDEINTRLAIAM